MWVLPLCLQTAKVAWGALPLLSPLRVLDWNCDWGTGLASAIKSVSPSVSPLGPCLPIPPLARMLHSLHPGGWSRACPSSLAPRSIEPLHCTRRKLRSEGRKAPSSCPCVLYSRRVDCRAACGYAQTEAEGGAGERTDSAGLSVSVCRC